MDLVEGKRYSVFLLGKQMAISQALMTHLHRLYEVERFECVQEAMRAIVASESPKLLLLSKSAGRSENQELIIKLRNDPALCDIPVVMYGQFTVMDLNYYYILGVTSHVVSSWPVELICNVLRSQMDLYSLTVATRSLNHHISMVAKRTSQQKLSMQDVSIHAMASIIGSRDSETGNHILRTQHYIYALCNHLRHKKKFGSVLTDEYIDEVYKAAPLHDIGKVGIPDSILLKPGRLTPEEFEVMKRHPVYGKVAIEKAEKRIGASINFLQVAKEIAYSHHEKWDGTGYPEGLSGTAIPLSARLMALADVYDALISRRPYKKPFSHHDAVAFIVAGRATHFDPDLVDAFIEINSAFQSIASQFEDETNEEELTGIAASLKAA